MTAAVEGLGEDPGAQPQRTALAWNRTVMATVLGYAGVAVTAQRLDLPVVAVLAAVAAVLMVVLADRLRGWRPAAPQRYGLMRQAVLAIVALAALGTVAATAKVLG